MHQKEVIHSNGSYVRKSRGRKLADEMGRAKRIPIVHYRVMHRKRVTSELHDSYFCLMTIKHSMDVERLYNSVEFDEPGRCKWSSRLLETRCGRESDTRPRGGGSGTPMEWTPASGEQERHNVTVITVGSKCYSLCSISSSLSHANLEQPFRTLAIKWEVNILLKKCSSVFLHASVFIIALFVTAS